MQARLVELLARAAEWDEPNCPLHVDESVACGSPGKVVDACAIHYILKIPTEEHVYFGPGTVKIFLCWFNNYYINYYIN